MADKVLRMSSHWHDQRVVVPWCSQHLNDNKRFQPNTKVFRKSRSQDGWPAKGRSIGVELDQPGDQF